MSINFTFYPESNRVPGVYVEMDPSQANTATTFQRSIVLGQITDDGNAPPLRPIAGVEPGADLGCVRPRVAVGRNGRALPRHRHIRRSVDFAI